jgi:asparagine synthase (glutamine-hydrolysing)
MVARAMTSTDWNTDDVFMNCGITLAEKRCPFLDPRLLEFAMAVPALPWLFNKHLLRRAMADRLPAPLVARSKTPLGTLHDSLLAVATPSFGGGNRPADALSRFVEPARIGMFAESGDSAGNYVNLRPFVLDLWLKHLRV